MQTLDEFVEELRIAYDNNEDYNAIYDNKVQSVVENEIRRAGMVKEEFIKEVASSEIRRAWEEGHSSGVLEVANYLFDIAVI